MSRMLTKASSMAYFTALPVPPEVIQTLQTIRPALTYATWVHPDDYHLTLAYLGDPAPEALTEFWHNISMRVHPSQTIWLNRLHLFRTHNGCVLVLLAEVIPELEALHADHVQTARSTGIDVHTFPQYMPHVTLASFPEQVVNLEDVMLPAMPTYDVRSVTLYKSHKPHGTGVGRYDVVQTYPLQKA